MRWSEPATLALLGVLALLVSAAATAWARGHALRRGMLDQPGARRSHVVPTPRGGGIGIAIVGLAMFAWLGATDGAWWWLAGIGLLLVAAAGWWDDHRPASPLLRLAIHALAGVALAGALALQGAGPWGIALGFALAVGLVNVWNFMDGIDGLAASQGALCAAGVLAVAGGPVALLALATGAACLGFLPFNLPRARIFMGDVGSGALGYLLATLMAFTALDLPALRWPLLLLPVSAFLVDATMTLGWRMLRGERWWTPHVQHLYQRASRRFGHGRTMLAYAVWTIATIMLMMIAMGLHEALATAVAGGVLLAALATWIGLHRRWRGATEGFGA
ncbi:glycosyltransferase family 4 protein [Thermomonas brevis]